MKTFLKSLVRSASSIGLFIAAQVSTAELLTDANAIIHQAEQAAYYAGDDGRSAARMIIRDSQGRKQIRQFTILRRDDPDSSDQDLLVFFSKPADIRGTVFRVHKRNKQEDDRWLYLPGLDLVKRISASDKRTSFIGSHFFYEDVSGRSTSLDEFKLIKTTASRYHLKATPKNKNSVAFSHYNIEIDTTTRLPMSITFFNQKSKAYRKVETLKVADINGHPTVLHSKISDLTSGAFTEMQFRRTSYDIGLPSTIFSERSMRTPPKKFMGK